MRFLTDRKRAEGKGAAHAGTGHHWHMIVSGVGLALVVPAFLYIFGSTLGQGRDAVLETFAHPAVAILSGLVVVVGMQHFRSGVQTLLEDYTHGSTRKVTIVLATALSYAIMATGLFALAKIAL
ncbi:succinate dehydrogenase, hydrophobic membrane anchor protein [Roseovarius sp. TE539]|uniref:succinate dehydrogenase, hydrophobic membrane anchor protein n=1 Tax=Roseovarius sp. TE539 TaxID=2249812 RepID=UPI000DE155F9|nr:succinate dehydrogenase, hydrophobic membrane anchor protein [Roseovarius sp. TE539]RBI72341.1 succinate dehydrogenase, hydrophobic membrane anchor protein [Roseovarius sp. TE539]